MASRASTEHQWEAAVNVDLPETLARQAKRRGTVRVPADTKVEVLEIYCRNCRRPWEKAQGSPCEAAVSKDHLIGGPTGERMKRKHPGHDCERYGCDLDLASTARQ